MYLWSTRGFSFIENCYLVFSSGCTVSYSHWQCLKVSIVRSSYLRFILFVFFKPHILVSLQTDLIIIIILISLRTIFSYFSHMRVYLPWWHACSNILVIFLKYDFFFLINLLKSSLHILDKKVLSDKLDSCKPFGPTQFVFFTSLTAFSKSSFWLLWSYSLVCLPYLVFYNGKF